MAQVPNNYQKEIAVKQFSLIDDPHVSEGIGTKSVDDEGVETKKQSLIEKGIFKNTYSNLFDSYKEAEQSTGNASRPGSPMGRSAEPISISKLFQKRKVVFQIILKKKLQ